MITVYTMDAQGLFTAAIEIDTMGPLPVPLTMTTPPTTTGTEVARWDGNAWEVLADRPPLPPKYPDLATGKAARLQELADLRWQQEGSGTTMGGNPLATDRTTQAKLTAAYVKASADPAYTIADWKSGPGTFSPLDAATIMAAADAVEAHVQACFSNEAALSASILAATDMAALEAVDITTGWP